MAKKILFEKIKFQSQVLLVKKIVNKNKQE